MATKTMKRAAVLGVMSASVMGVGATALASTSTAAAPTTYHWYALDGDGSVGQMMKLHAVAEQAQLKTKHADVMYEIPNFMSKVSGKPVFKAQLIYRATTPFMGGTVVDSGRAYAAYANGYNASPQYGAFGNPTHEIVLIEASDVAVKMSKNREFTKAQWNTLNTMFFAK